MKLILSPRPTRNIGQKEKRGRFRKSNVIIVMCSPIEVHFKSISTSPHQQIPEKEPTGSEAPTQATTEATEDNKPVIEEKPNTPVPENQQGTDERPAEAQGNDTEPEVIKSVCLWWCCLPSYLLKSLLWFGFL